MLRPLARGLLRLLYGVKVRGRMEPHARLLVIANHQSFLDAFLLGAFLPVQPVWLVHSTIARHWWVKAWLHFFPHFVVDWSNPWAIKSIVGLLEAGEPVVIFPEGRITVTSTLMKIYEGPAFAAARSGATVVAVHIDGAVYSKFSRMSGDFPRRWFPRISLTIHEPVSIPMPEARTARERRRLAAEQLRRLMELTAFEARRPSTLFEAFLDARRLYGGRRQVLEDIRRQKQQYSQILTASLALGRIAARLAPEGERVGVAMPNLTTTVSLLLGLFAMRRVPAVLNFSAGSEAMQAACRAAGVRVVLTSRAFLEQARLAPTFDRLEGVRVVYLEDLRPTFTLADKLWLLLYARWFPRRVMRPSQPSDNAVVLFTSGSEGRPKGVALSHDNILANIRQIHSVLEFSSKDKFLSALPMFHVFGLTVGVLLPLLNGCRIFLYPSPLHYRVIPEVIYDLDCTVMLATGTFLGKYAVGAHPYDFRSVRLVVTGAEKLAEEVRSAYAEKFGLRIVEGYGATETSPVISANTFMASRPGTVGQFLPGVEHRLEPVPGIERGGLLHVRGPNVMLGYLQDGGTLRPPASVFGEGWYSTGDVADVDAAGFVTLLGRVRRFAKVAGEMVSLELVERIAAAAAPRSEHAATAVEETGRGEAIVLFTSDPALGRESLQQAARQIGAPALAVPRRIVHLEKIPALAHGKKDYLLLHRMAQDAASMPRRA